MNILDIVLRSAESAFLEVGVFVGAALLIFGYINYKKSGAVMEFIGNKKKLQPIIGALLGLTPGCGGAIIVMPLFMKNTVTFGTVVATLIATMGDSAFVLMTRMPKTYIWIVLISFVAAIGTGYIVDNLGIGKNLIKIKKDENIEGLKLEHKEFISVPTEYERGLSYHDIEKTERTHIGHEEGDYVDMALHHKKEPMNLFWHKFTHTWGYKVFWLLAGVGVILGILLLAQVDVNSQLGIPNIGLVLGTIGTLLGIIYTVVSKKIIKDDTHEETESKMLSLKEMFIHNAGETAFVTTWVFVAFVIYEFGIQAIGGEEMLISWLALTGVAPVIIGACIGLIPGCGPQIMFVALFTKGALPFAALIANAISQDGDALFPLLAMDKKSSLLATIVTTVPAIIIGLIFFYA